MAGFRLLGTSEHVQRYLDHVYLACDVAGIIELDDAQGVDIWLQPDSAPLPTPSAGLQLEPCAPPAADAGEWQRDDALIAVHEQLVVRPPWVAPPPTSFAGVDLVVPRGMAFGSGEHESTQLALRLMHRCCSGGSLADVGTGSGILARYAVELGCAPVHACDVEVDAVSAAQALAPTATVRHGDARVLLPLGRTAHVVANMTTEELIASLPDLVALWNRLGVLLLSGVRHDDADRVRALLPMATKDAEQGPRFTAMAWAGGSCP